MQAPNIIRYEESAENSVLVYKTPLTDFTKPTILIVGEAQRALLYSDGCAEGPFRSGKYLLPTENFVTFREKFARLFKGKKEKYLDRSVPFTCDIIFVNMVSDFTLAWGTPNPIQVEDPKYHLILGVRGNGELKLRVIDPMRFVVGTVGQLKSYTLDMIKRTIKADLMPVLLSTISRTINEGAVSILEIASKLPELSQAVQAGLSSRLADFGLEALHLNICTIEAGPNDLDALKQAKAKFVTAVTDIDIEALKTTRLAEAQAQARRAQGYTYRDEKEFEIQKASSQSTKVEITSVPFAAAAVVNPTVASPSAAGQCAFCSSALPTGAKFCCVCGKSTTPTRVFCTACGKEIIGKPKFCSNCGNRVAAEKRLCANCHAELAEGVVFCPECGTRN